MRLTKKFHSLESSLEFRLNNASIVIENTHGLEHFANYIPNLQVDWRFPTNAFGENVKEGTRYTGHVIKKNTVTTMSVWVMFLREFRWQKDMLDQVCEVGLSFRAVLLSNGLSSNACTLV